MIYSIFAVCRVLTGVPEGMKQGNISLLYGIAALIFAANAYRKLHEADML